MKDRILHSVSNFFKYYFVPAEETENRQAIVDNIKATVEFRGTRLWLLIFSVLVICTGIAIDSSVVIFGGLLLSPVTGSIAGLSVAVLLAERSTVILSVRSLLLIICTVILIAFFYFLAVPVADPVIWVMRTAPTIWDALIAFFGGMALVLWGHGRRNGFVIAGVSVATTFLIPLCTAGYYLANFNSVNLLGALNLFIVNVIFIWAAGYLLLRILNFHRVGAAPDQGKRMMVSTIAVSLTIVIASLGLINRELFKNRAEAFIRNEIVAKDMFVIGKKIQPLSKQIFLLVYGETMHDTAMRRIATNKRFYGLQDADIRIRYAANSIINQDSINQYLTTRGREYNDNVLEINEKELMTRQFKRERRKFDFERIPPEIYKEFNALFGVTNELAIDKALTLNENNVNDTVILIYIRQPTGAIKMNNKQIEKWARVRLNEKEIRIMIK